MAPADISAPDVDNTVLLILCGGKATRMGGEDKPLISVRNAPMVEHVANSVPARMTRLISANRNEAKYERLGILVRDQEVFNKHDILPGPLVGVLAGLQKISGMQGKQWLLISPGDTPNLESSWWHPLFDAATSRYPNGRKSVTDGLLPGFVVFDGERQQNLHMLIHVSCGPNLLDYLTMKEVAVYRWLERIRAHACQAGSPSQFINVNQPEDL